MHPRKKRQDVRRRTLHRGAREVSREKWGKETGDGRQESARTRTGLQLPRRPRRGWAGLGSFVIAAELPQRLEEFGIAGVPQAASVEVGAELTDRRDQLAAAHLRDQLAQLAKAGTNLGF